MTDVQTTDDDRLHSEETRKLPEALLNNLYSVIDDGNNNPDIPVKPEKLGIDEFLVDRMSHKPPDKYKFRRSIACGGMKMVLEVRDMDTMRDVAMAVLPDADKRPAMDILRFVQEARLTASLEHPNIVPVHDIGIDANGSPYFTMKLLRGKTLAALLSHLADGDPEPMREYPLPRLLRIFLKICSGVAFAHSRCVLHLDLKPENIQLGDFGEVLIIDWGLAKMIESDRTPRITSQTNEDKVGSFVTADAVMKGTPGYMAPEQAFGRGSAKDERTDIYALGAILYAMLTLKNPISRKPIKEMIRDTIQGNILPPKLRVPEREIPAALDAVVRKAMSLSPDDRYDSVTELRDEVNAFIGGYATVAEKASAFKRVLLLFNRHKILTASIAFLLLFLAGTGIFALRENQRRKEAWLPLCSMSFTTPGTIPVARGVSFRNAALSPADGSLWRGAHSGMLLPHNEWLFLNYETNNDWKLELRYVPSGPGDSFEVRMETSPDCRGADGTPAGFLWHSGANDGTRDLLFRQDKGADPVLLSGALSEKTPGAVRRTVFLRENGKLSIRTDGAKSSVSAVDFLPPNNTNEGQIAIRALTGGIRLLSLNFTTRGTAERTTPLIAADALIEVHLYKEAFDKYLRIAETYADTAFCDRALLNAYRIAALYAPDLPNREKRMSDLKKTIALRKHFTFFARIREIDAARLWLDGQITSALRVAELILAADPANDILFRLVTLSRPALSPSDARLFFRLLARMKEVHSLDISGLGLTELPLPVNIRPEYLDCSRNPIADLSVLESRPLRMLVTDDGVFHGDAEIQAYLRKRHASPQIGYAPAKQ